MHDNLHMKPLKLSNDFSKAKKPNLAIVHLESSILPVLFQKNFGCDEL